MKIVQKFNKSTKQFGARIEKGAHRIGHKLNNVLARSNGLMRHSDNTMRELNSSGASLLPGIGMGMRVAGVGAHIGHKITESASQHKSQDLEKYNRRKAKEDSINNGLGNLFV